MLGLDDYQYIENHIRYIIDQCREQRNADSTLYLSNNVLQGDDKLLLLLDEKKNYFCKIICRNGSFVQFPGIEYQEYWLKYMEMPINENVSNNAYVVKRDNDTFLFIWEVQKYYFDPGDEDGYGYGDYSAQVCLYSILDENGKFCKPFKLYSIGDAVYYKGQTD